MTEPDISPVSQLWQTPVRHDQRTGTLHASASSSRLWNAEPQWTARLLRVKDISGPTSAVSPGGCGGHRGTAAMPGVFDGSDPKFPTQNSRVLAVTGDPPAGKAVDETARKRGWTAGV